MVRGRDLIQLLADFKNMQLFALVVIAFGFEITGDGASQMVSRNLKSGFGLRNTRVCFSPRQIDPRVHLKRSIQGLSTFRKARVIIWQSEVANPTVGLHRKKKH